MHHTSHLTQPLASSELVQSKLEVKISRTLFDNINVWPAPRTSPPLPSLQLRAQCVQNSNCDDEGARERGEGRAGEGAASQRVAW